ncbi:MAG: hypothetical protein EAZ37_00275 [Burkholderiales bacterium]|nr:MAG: hypothetical protein EAZ43_10835 [Betaproteobacteria bacterium]TAG28934.1 MAG: hypothetical protein EAZ37_00275 [Burkholderiales bacterium]
MKTFAASLTRRHLPPRCSRIANSRPKASKRVPRTLFDAFVTDPQGLQTSYTYNGHNNLITQSSPDTGTTRFKYNAMGNVTAKIDSMNRCTTTAYDNLHRPTVIKYYKNNGVRHDKQE